jgi:hypothetical protein
MRSDRPAFASSSAPTLAPHHQPGGGQRQGGLRHGGAQRGEDGNEGDSDTADDHLTVNFVVWHVCLQDEKEKGKTDAQTGSSNGSSAI